MALKSYAAPRPDNWVTLGGFTKKGQKNPTKAEGYYLGTITTKDTFNDDKDKVTIMLKTPTGVTGINGNANLVYKMADSERGFKEQEGRTARGAYVVVTCTGEVKSKKGNPMKTFTVEFDSENTIDVLTLPETTEESDSDYSDEEDTDTEDSSSDDYYDQESEETTSKLVAEQAARKAKVQDLFKNKKA